MTTKLLERNKAVKLRESGHSVKEIARLLAVSASSVSLWVRHVELDDAAKERLLQRTTNPENHKYLADSRAKRSDLCRLKRRQWQNDGATQAKDKQWLYIAGCMLYWGEGAKERNRVKLTNGDPAMMALFCSFLLNCFAVERNEIQLEIRYHIGNTKSLEDIRACWLEQTDLAEDNIHRIVAINDKRCNPERDKDKLPYGIAQISVHRTDIVQQIFGGIKELAGIQDKELWLN